MVCMDRPLATPFFLARAKLRLTQAEVADRAGCDAATVSRVERGEPSSTDTVAAIARALGMSAQELGEAVAMRGSAS